MKRHLVHIRDLDRPEIVSLLDAAETMLPIAKGERRSQALAGKLLATLFFEPSTRTRLSFEAAMARLGGQSTGIPVAEASSLQKGESLSDTIKTVSRYSDGIVLRHPNEGAARLAAKVSSVPIVNAGDGAGQHPTQTLLDLFTIRREKGGIEGQRVALVGDLKYGRTVHSLAYALALFGAEMTFVSPPALAMPQDALDDLEAAKARFHVTTDLAKAAETCDVLYLTRIQKERFADPEEYRKVAGTYRVDRDLLASAKKGAIVMHPLPRVDEVSPGVDETPHAKYFDQAFYGVPVRMALLARLLGAPE